LGTIDIIGCIQTFKKQVEQGLENKSISLHNNRKWWAEITSDSDELKTAWYHSVWLIPTQLFLCQVCSPALVNCHAGLSGVPDHLVLD
jgi:hypothetical protein